MLAEKLASVGLLSAGVAHEINNPLEIIYNYLDHIRLKSGGNPEMEVAVRGIESEIESISQITSNLILFGESKVEETELVELNELLLTILELVRRTAERKGIEIVARPDEHSLFCSANRNELKQVILNLVKNAFEAMPTGGRITVATELERLDNRKRIRLLVRDTGAGISVRNREDLFLPFFTTKDEREENLGLGLAISYSLVRRYNGNIEVRSPPDGGAEFVVVLPAADGPAPPRPSPG
jgi:signal transduction histidine kinase